jgi:hypothetical protein
MRQVCLSLCVCAVVLANLSAARPEGGWRPMFNGKDLAGWRTNPTHLWYVDEQGVLTWKDAAIDLWTERQYGDFELNLEFKVSAGANSGLFIRTGDIKDNVQSGIEIQIYDSYGKAPAVHHCGAVYDALAPRVNAERKPGEWNRMHVVAQGSKIEVTLNGQGVIDMEVERWSEPGKNPDGSKNKFARPLKEFPRRGFIGIQDHHKQVWFRNMRIRELAQ